VPLHLHKCIFLITGLLQKVDAAELLRLYLNYDLLEEAVELVSEYVDAVLGKGHQYFGIEVGTYRCFFLVLYHTKDLKVNSMYISVFNLYYL
jgi:hypothetical protein